VQLQANIIAKIFCFTAPPYVPGGGGEAVTQVGNLSLTGHCNGIGVGGQQG